MQGFAHMVNLVKEFGKGRTCHRRNAIGTKSRCANHSTEHRKLLLQNDLRMIVWRENILLPLFEILNNLSPNHLRHIQCAASEIPLDQSGTMRTAVQPDPITRSSCPFSGIFRGSTANESQ